MAHEFVRHVRDVDSIDKMNNDNVANINDLISDKDSNVYVKTNQGYKLITVNVDKMNQKIDELQSTQQNLTTDLKTSQDKVTALETNLKTSQDTIKKLQSDLSTKDKSIKDLQQELTKYYPLTKGDGSRFDTLDDSIKNVEDLKTGLYEFSTANYALKGMPDGTANSVVDVTVTTGYNKRKQFLVTKSQTGETWIKTLHTDGVAQNDWQKIV